jgi:hypothetical protein
MDIEKKITRNNESLYLPITKDLAAYLEIEEGSEVIIRDENGKKGKFAAFWKKV